MAARTDSPPPIHGLRRRAWCLCAGSWAALPVPVSAALTHSAAPPGQPPSHPTLPGRELQHRLPPDRDASAATPRVALTLDACGGAADTELVEYLVRERIPATVFVTARWLAGHVQVLRTLRLHAELFELHNHGERHVPAVIGAQLRVYGLPGAADLEAFRREVREGARAVEAATGQPPRWYRAATARYDEQALQELARMGVRVAGFSINADAGGTLSAAEVAARVGRARDGDVILAHLNRPASGTRAGLEQALPALRRQGIAFVHLGTRELVETRGRQP
jgi:peptidoglycan/xylan/chitin deacetylase (PgdA/CDA1 family)